MGRDPRDADELAEIEALEKDGLDASDEALAELRDGRYGATVGDRASIMARILQEGTRPIRWRKHYRGYSCRRCGGESLTATFVGRHDRFHAWLDKVIALIGKDLDRVDGELELVRDEIADVRAECAVRCDRAEARAAAAEAQVAHIMTLVGPILARAYPAEAERMSATVTVEDRNAKEPVTAAD